MKLVDHPFLTDSATWDCAGTRVDGRHAERVDCRIRVRRSATGWAIVGDDGERRRAATLPAVRYDVRQPRQRGERADWTAVDPSYGRLIGQFVSVDDSISSTFISADGAYSGSEWLMLDGDGYRSRGVVLRDGELVCRWTLTLSCTQAAVALPLLREVCSPACS